MGIRCAEDRDEHQVQDSLGPRTESTTTEPK